MTASLFSYGTLQRQDVQTATFGRSLHGEPDTLTGFRKEMLLIPDPLVAVAGQNSYPVVLPSADPGDMVAGVVFELSLADLKAADAYEGSDYRRIAVRLKSGREAWVYTKA